MQETYICSYGSTPIGGFQGSLSKIPATKLGSIVIESILDNTLLPKDKINDGNNNDRSDQIYFFGV